MPGYMITLSHPDDYTDATGKGLNNLGVHFFINQWIKTILMNID